MDILISSTNEAAPKVGLTEKQVDILVFKTTIRYKKDVKMVSSTLNECTFINRWNIDLDDCDKVLRVESQILDHQTIISIIKKAGYNCEELAD